MKIVIDGIEYKKVNLETEFSMTQDKYAKQILAKTFQQMESTDIDGLQKILKADKKSGIGLNEQIKAMGSIMATVDDFPEILALIYIEKNEKRFVEDTYETRRKKLGDAMLTAEMENDIQNFLNLKISLMGKGTLTYLTKALTGTN